MEVRIARSGLLAAGIAVCSLTVFLSCGTGTISTAQDASTGKVLLYFTDSIADFKQVVLTVDKVQLINSGVRTSCNLLNSLPVTMDIPRLSGLMQLVNEVECEAGAYNRIHIELDQNVELVDATGVPSACRFTSYLDSSDKLNTLQCAAGICSLDINGAVRRGALSILADRNNKLALDFDLKNFIVQDFGDPSTCSVTMKVTPLEDSEIAQRRSRESVSGGIFDLNTVTRSFTLRKNGKPFTVSYGSISESAQPGLDFLLQIARDERFTALIQAPKLDTESGLVEASALSVKVRGIVQTLHPSADMLTLKYRPPNLTMQVSFDPAAVDGILANSSDIEVKLSGYDMTNEIYRAERVAVKEGGRETDN